jgi:hypothetical protein
MSNSDNPTRALRRSVRSIDLQQVGLVELETGACNYRIDPAGRQTPTIAPSTAGFTSVHTTATALASCRAASQRSRAARRGRGACSAVAQAALGPGLLNADDVNRAHLQRAGDYLTKIIAITTTEATRFAALLATTRGMPQRRTLVAGLRTALTDERAAAGAARKGNLAAFTAAFDRLILHGHPTGRDYRTLIRTEKAAAGVFPFKVCGKEPAIYP